MAGTGENQLEVKVKIPQGEKIPDINNGSEVTLSWPNGSAIAFKKAGEIEKVIEKELEGVTA